MVDGNYWYRRPGILGSRDTDHAAPVKPKSDFTPHKRQKCRGKKGGRVYSPEKILSHKKRLALWKRNRKLQKEGAS